MKRIYTNLFLIFISFLFITNACRNKKALQTSADIKTAERISDAETFDDVFRLEKEIQLSNNEGYFITSLYDILIGKNKDIIIRDEGPNCRLIVFDSSGIFKRFIGKLGDGPGEYNSIQSITINSNGEILLFDIFGFKVSVFDSNYNFIRLFRTRSSFRALYAFGKDKLFLHETNPFAFKKSKNQNAIIQIDYKGDTIKSFAPRQSILNTLPFSPANVGIGFDKQNHIYEMNPMLYEIRKFDFKGNLIVKIGDGKVILIDQEEGNGKKHQVPVLIYGPFIFDSKIIMINTDKRLDFYDDEGKLIKKGVKFDKKICEVIENKLYIVDSSNGDKNPKILVYTFK